MCLIPLVFINPAISAEVNWGPLSDTKCSGRPYAANNLLSSLIVAVAVVNFISTTSGQFWMRVHYYQKVLSIHRACEIDMYPLPWSHRPYPRMQWWNSRSIFSLLTRDTWFDHLLYFWIYFWPPYIASWPHFHADNSDVTGEVLLAPLSSTSVIQ